ncbi:hypothetical protein LWI29_037842 [Acer saccharum]|uniref:RNase H type-1 domain-containing protein n=1 Tax=Acer saccharum TaxID=4024 RepID=A0AA39S033_ACESA|nr:hypothetical protein LWI29_037842 [Acer saccharum]
MESWCMMAWGIRSCRNYFIHNKKVKPPLVLLNWVFNLLKEFQSTSNIASRNVSLGQFDAEVAWLPPPSRTLKLNSNAAVKDGSPHIGLGAIIRDSSGKVVVALAKPLVGNFSIEIGEFLAVRESLCLAKRFQLKVSWVERDAVNVVSGILKHIEEIRRKKFFIGGEVNPLMEEFTSLSKMLSAELYAKDVHFLMELIQAREPKPLFSCSTTRRASLLPTLTPFAVLPSPPRRATENVAILARKVCQSQLVGRSEDSLIGVPVHSSRVGAVPVSSEGPSSILDVSAGAVVSISSATSMVGQGSKVNRDSVYPLVSFAQPIVSSVVSVDELDDRMGIGFKSVFLITTRPYIFSNGYQIRFDEDPCPHCNLGYVVPEWVEENPKLSEIQHIYGSGSTLPTTTLILPLKADKIKRLSVREHNENPKLNTVSAIAITSETNFVKSKNIDAESSTLHLAAQGDKFDKECSYYMWKQKFPVNEKNKVERRMEVDEWFITLAFPYGERLQRGTTSPGIYAFLPTEMVTNFPFIMQADFLLSSSRETINFDDKWNKGILDCVPDAFVNALTSW